MFAGFDRTVLQLKPGLLMTEAEAGEVLTRLDAAIAGLMASGILGAGTTEAGGAL
jgi:hypothetical protein